MADDEFAQFLRLRLEEIFEADGVTPGERAYWDAYDRVMEAAHREEEAARARMLGNAKAITAWINANPSVLDERAPGASAVMAEHGLRFTWEAT